MATGAHFGCPKFIFDRISNHFRMIRNFCFLIFTKWPAAPILDVRNSLSMAFLAISDRYSTYIFWKSLTKWLPSAILDVGNSILNTFLAILDQYLIFIYFIFFTKWPPAPILDVRNSLSIAFLAISDRYATFFYFKFFGIMAAVGHFGCPQFTFDWFSGHFRSIHNFILFLFFTKWPPADILDHFWLHFWPFQIDGPFWISEIHFR